jgi:SAM-dependent methyltransferase
MIGSGIDRPLSLLGVDMDRPNAARMYDYWLGGSHNVAADREVCNRLADLLPGGRDGIWSNRAFLRRVVQYLVTECGVTQFLDLGSGIPTAGNVHEIAQRADPAARVVYVDIDPIAVAHARHILGGNDRCAAVHADLRSPDDVLDDLELRGVLDLTRPVAVTLFSVLGFVADEEQPRTVVQRYLSRLVPGSYLAISQSADYRSAPAGYTRALRDYQRAIGMGLTNRTREDVAGFFNGLDLREPGVVHVDRWRPDSQTPGRAIPFVGAVARKPL